ncbi:YoaK family protein [Chryseobacterium wanjuense]
MFRHKGKGRTYSHNLKLASILSCVAGLVNITGVLAVSTLTTNVTGHFAYFSEQLFLRNFKMASIYLLYILFFLSGAFVSGLIMEWASRHRPHTSYIIPLSLEMMIMLLTSFSSEILPNTPSVPIIISSALLFAMGLQNALVTRVSQSVVRTTHLTGLFTDLGIELSQFFSSIKRK